MTTDFQRALAVTLRFEGGYSNHPNDPGGATNYGIIQRTYDGWRKSKSLEPRDVRQIDHEEVETIYRDRFWRRAKCDDHPYPVALCLFDWSVNSGTGVAANALASTGPDVPMYLAARWTFLTDLMQRREKSRVFRNGWARRCNTLCRTLGAPLVALPEYVKLRPVGK
jgi:hypothetical protein